MNILFYKFVGYNSNGTKIYVRVRRLKKIIHKIGCSMGLEQFPNPVFSKFNFMQSTYFCLFRRVWIDKKYPQKNSIYYCIKLS